MTKITRLPEYLWDELGVPEILRHAVKVLEQALAIDRNAVSYLLCQPMCVTPRAYEEFIGHPSIVVGEKAGDVGGLISALGLLNGIVGTDKFRLFVNWEEKSRSCEYVGIVSIDPE